MGEFKRVYNLHNNFWTDEEIDFIKNNYLLYSNKKLGEKIGRTRSSVQNKLNELGIKRDNKYYFNYNYFKEIDSKEKAYWLGFIWADGYVQKYELGIELSIKDIEHLKKFNKCLNGNLQITTRKRNGCFKYKEYDNSNDIIEFCSIRIHNKQMIDDLIKYNIVPNKTYKSINCGLPNIPQEFLIYFIEGYFDGDGAILKNKKHNCLNANITSVNKIILEEIRLFLYENYKISSYIITSKKAINSEISNLDTYQICFKGMNNCYKFLSLIYNNNLYLDRKYQTFKDCVKNMNLEKRVSR